MKRLCFLMLLASLLMASYVVMNAKPKDDDVVRILAIGNSFSVDALEDHFYELASAAGKKVIVGNMYIGGCRLKRHLKNAPFHPKCVFVHHNPCTPYNYSRFFCAHSSNPLLTKRNSQSIIRSNTKPLEEREVKNSTLLQRAAGAGNAAQRDC